jgi:hypothetical protein
MLIPPTNKDKLRESVIWPSKESNSKGPELSKNLSKWEEVHDGIKIWGGFHKAIYALRLKSALCAHPFSPNLLYFGIMHLPLAINLFHFLPDLGALYALCHVSNFYEIDPWWVV